MPHCGVAGLSHGAPLSSETIHASLGHKGVVGKAFLCRFYERATQGKGPMPQPEFNNDNLPSNNPSMKTVLVVLCSIGLVVTLIMYHSTFGL